MDQDRALTVYAVSQDSPQSLAELGALTPAAVIRSEGGLEVARFDFFPDPDNAGPGTQTLDVFFVGRSRLTSSTKGVAEWSPWVPCPIMDQGAPNAFMAIPLAAPPEAPIPYRVYVPLSAFDEVGIVITRQEAEDDTVLVGCGSAKFVFSANSALYAATQETREALPKEPEATKLGIAAPTVAAQAGAVIRFSGAVTDDLLQNVADDTVKLYLSLVDTDGGDLAAATAFAPSSGDGGNTTVTPVGATGLGLYEVNPHTDGTYDVDVTDVAGNSGITVAAALIVAGVGASGLDIDGARVERTFNLVFAGP